MSLAEWIVIVAIAIIAFGPKQLPMLAAHLAKGIRFLQQLQQELFALWDAYQKEQTLKENEEKARLAAQQYSNDTNEPVEKDHSP